MQVRQKRSFQAREIENGWVITLTKNDGECDRNGYPINVELFVTGDSTIDNVFAKAKSE